MTTEGMDKLYHAWNYLLTKYKRNDQLPKKYWDANEVFESLIWDLRTEDIHNKFHRTKGIENCDDPQCQYYTKRRITPLKQKGPSD